MSKSKECELKDESHSIIVPFKIGKVCLKFNFIQK